MKLYGYLLSLFCVLLVVSNICATKLIGIGPFIFDGGAILFPLTYIFGDIFSEVYGFKLSRNAIIISFGIQIFVCLILVIVGLLPASSDWGFQESYDNILGFVPRIVIASLIAYLVGQLLNARTMVFMKAKNQGKYLFLRMIVSTIIGEFADSVIFCTVACIGEISVDAWLNYTLTGFGYKTSVEIIFLPVTYLVIKLVRKQLAKDPIDNILVAENSVNQD